MTTANKITIFRILAVPVFIMEMLYFFDTGNDQHRWLAFFTFGIAAVLDGVDGYVARRYNQRSELGAILDPLADKFLLVSGVILLSLPHPSSLERIPLWLTGIILGRDVILTLGLAIIYYFTGRVTVRPAFVGKLATVFQMMIIVSILLKWGVVWLNFWIIAAGVFTASSGVIYFAHGCRQLSLSPTSSATPGQGVGDSPGDDSMP